MHPGVDVGFTCRRFRLSNLVFMMGKGQIRPTAMNIEGVPQAAGGHRGALDVPTRSPVSPGGMPVSFTGLGRFPEHEIQRVFFVHIHVDPCTRAHVIQQTVIQFAVVGELAHSEQTSPLAAA